MTDLIHHERRRELGEASLVVVEEADVRAAVGLLRLVKRARLNLGGWKKFLSGIFYEKA